MRDVWAARSDAGSLFDDLGRLIGIGAHEIDSEGDAVGELRIGQLLIGKAIQNVFIMVAM